MKSSPSILLAEDDENLGYILKEYLEMNDYTVLLVQDGEAAVMLFNQHDFDICILDVMMPKLDGFGAAKQIKRINEHIPIMFLTAKSLKVDKLKGFKIGADDYIVKPIDEEELIARINAVVRRTKMATVRPLEQTTFHIGNYLFDYSNQQLIINQTKNVITTKEAEILKALCENQGRILERKATLRALWGESDYFNRRSMDVFISKLRKYLRHDPNIKIRNVHGKGFVLEVLGDV